MRMICRYVHVCRCGLTKEKHGMVFVLFTWITLFFSPGSIPQAVTLSLHGVPNTKNAEVILKLKHLTLNKDLVAEVKRK